MQGDHQMRNTHVCTHTVDRCDGIQPVEQLVKHLADWSNESGIAPSDPILSRTLELALSFHSGNLSAMDKLDKPKAALMRALNAVRPGGRYFCHGNSGKDNETAKERRHCKVCDKCIIATNYPQQRRHGEPCSSVPPELWNLHRGVSWDLRVGDVTTWIWHVHLTRLISMECSARPRRR